MATSHDVIESRPVVSGQFGEQLRQLRAEPGFVVGAPMAVVTFTEDVQFSGPGSTLEVPLDATQLHSVLGGARVTSVRADVEPVQPFAMMPTTPDYSRPDQGVFDGAKVAGAALVPPAPPEAPAALIHYDATQDPAYYHQAPPALSGPPAVTLRELVDTLGMHPGGSALIHQIHQVCGALPGNVSLLQELSQYVNQPPGQHLPGYMLRGGVVGTGDVTGPGVSTDNAIARYDGTTSNVIQNSGVTINDDGNMSGGASITIAKNLFTGNGNAAKPSHSFQGDTGSGMFRAAGTLGFSVSETQLLELKLNSGNTITGNTTVQGDLKADNLDLANPLPITEGGTGASTASGARTNLGLGSLATLNTVGTSQIDSDAVTDAKLRNSAARSVIGRSANSTGDPADIAGTNNQVLRIDGLGTSLGFGAVNLASSAAVAGALPVANGGTGATDAATARSNLGVQSSVLSVMTSNLTLSTSMQTTVLGGAVENGGWYAVEGLLLLTTSNTVGVRVDFDNGSCTLDSITYSVIKNSAGTLTAAAPNTSRSIDTTINAATVTNCMFWFKGYFKVDASGAGNLFLRADRVSASGTQTLLAGSWMRFTRLA